MRAREEQFSREVTLQVRAGRRKTSDPFVHEGFSGLHPKQSGPTAHIDPLSGNPNVVTTDLVLPEKAGIDLAITRWYSSQTTPGYPNDFWVEDST